VAQSHTCLAVTNPQNGSEGDTLLVVTVDAT